MLRPFVRTYLLLVAVLAPLEASGVASTAQTAVEDALKAIELGDYSKAEALLATDPTHQVLKGIVEFHRGKYGDAKETLEHAVAQRDEPIGRLFLALATAATSGCARARDDLSAFFERQPPSDPHRLAGLALTQCHMADGRVPEATLTLSRLANAYPTDEDVLFQTAKLHMKGWNDAVDRMFQHVPASFRVNQISAEIFEIQGRYAEAIVEYRKAIAKRPHALDLHFRLGRAILMESNTPGALEDAAREFHEELKLNPADQIAEYQLGQIAIAQRNPQEATSRFERALALNPEFPEALLALGRLLLDAQQPAKAIPLLETAVRLVPASEGAHYSLMIAYRNAGMADAAMREKEILERLEKAPAGEFTEFLKKLGEKPKQ